MCRHRRYYHVSRSDIRVVVGVWGSKVLLEMGVVEGVPVLPNLGAFGPTVAAFLLVAYANGFAGVRRLAGRAIQLDYPKQWILVALLLPPVIVGGALAIAVATGTTPTFPWVGQPIILLIAGTAVGSPDPRVLTRNVDEFARVDGLDVTGY